jgi:predicted AAA+ superfamily ATPase
MGDRASTRLSDTIWQGGYPEPALEPSLRELWIVSYFRTYLERDVRSIMQVSDLRLFEQFISLVAASHGQELNQARLASQVGVSQPTIKRWVGLLETSYVLWTLPPYFENLGKRLVKSPKVYYLDSALPCHLTRQPSATAALAGPLAGALFEGWCVTEAVKAFACRGQRPELYFWRSNDGLEVDLLLLAQGKIIPIEIKLTSTPTTTHGKALTKFCDLAGEKASKEGWLVCRVEKEGRIAGGHRTIPWDLFPSRIASLLDG